MTTQEKEAPIFPSLKEWHEQHSQKAAQVQAKSVGSTKTALVRTKAARVAPEHPRPSYWTTSLPWGEGTRRK